MEWHFDITEVSAAVYRCSATRITGETIEEHLVDLKMDGFVHRVCEVELARGTAPAVAVFTVFTAAQPEWKAEYNDKAFGSWLLESKNKKRKLVFDGKDQLLSFYFDGAHRWDKKLKDRTDVTEDMFAIGFFQLDL